MCTLKTMVNLQGDQKGSFKDSSVLEFLLVRRIFPGGPKKAT